MLSFLKKVFGLKTNETSVKIKTEKVQDEYSENEYSFDEIVEGWKRAYVKLNESASKELIANAQEQLNFIFPFDFVRFYKRYNGFKDWDTIGDMFSIWPLDRIIEEYAKSDNKNFIPFCDYLINSHWIGYMKNKSGVFKEFDELNPIADSFEETVKLIIKDSPLLY